MKVTNQNIPPALLTAYRKLVANKPANLQLQAVLRATKKAHQPNKPKTIRAAIRDIENAVDALITYMTARDGVAPAPTLRADQIDKLKRGIFDAAYWEECAITASHILDSFPTSTPYTGGRPYAYPDPQNQPTRATYPDGNISAAPVTYEGLTTGTTFQDVRLKWHRITWSLKNTFLPGSNEPAFIQITGTLAATASARGSRAMISTICKWWLVTNASAQPATLTAPTIKPKSIFWRYKMPATVAPYWSHTQQIQTQFSARIDKYTDTIGTISKCVLLLAPMPMMGWRYNNNTSVSSTLTATAKLWQIKKAQPRKITGTAVSRIDKLNQSGGETLLSTPGNVIYRDGANGKGNNVAMPWGAEYIARRVWPRGNSWQFEVVRTSPSYDYQLWQLNPDDTWSGPFANTYEDFFVATTPTNKSVLLNDIDFGQGWIDDAGNMSIWYQDDSWKKIWNVSDTGVSWENLEGPPLGWTFIPWATDAAGFNNGAYFFHVEAAVPATAPTEFIYTIP